MSAADEAERLRERADALDTEVKLETKLADAKDAYRGSDDPKLKDKFHKVRDELAAHRAARRDQGVTIGGDAFVSNNENEG
jgi:hypothetical protein